MKFFYTNTDRKDLTDYYREKIIVWPRIERIGRIITAKGFLFDHGWHGFDGLLAGGWYLNTDSTDLTDFYREHLGDMVSHTDVSQGVALG